MTATANVFKLKSTTTFIKYLRQTLFTDYNLKDMLVAPAAERNKNAMLEILQKVLPPVGQQQQEVLEIASGTGQHVAHFAQTLTHINFQPTEVDRSSLTSIQAYIKSYNLTNVKDPLHLDVTKPMSDWPPSVSQPESLDAIICTNMIHITPWACTEALFYAAGHLLKPKGQLITYGPYAVDGVLTPESNVNFDVGLKRQNPEWGVRDVRDLVNLGSKNGLQYNKTFDMPANNKILIFEKLSKTE